MFFLLHYHSKPLLVNLDCKLAPFVIDVKGLVRRGKEDDYQEKMGRITLLSSMSKVEIVGIVFIDGKGEAKYDGKGSIDVCTIEVDAVMLLWLLCLLDKSLS